MERDEVGDCVGGEIVDDELLRLEVVVLVVGAELLPLSFWTAVELVDAGCEATGIANNAAQVAATAAAPAASQPVETRAR